MNTIIWRFRTREGSVRLGVGAPRERFADLHGELKGCAAVADTFEEFIAMAVRAISAHGGIVGDVMRQPWPSNTPLREAISKAALSADPVEAASAVLDAAFTATDDEVDGFLTDPDQASLRGYVSDLARNLDEHAAQYVSDLAAALKVDSGQLLRALAEAG